MRISVFINRRDGTREPSTGGTVEVMHHPKRYPQRSRSIVFKFDKAVTVQDGESIEIEEHLE